MLFNESNLVPYYRLYLVMLLVHCKMCGATVGVLQSSKVNHFFFSFHIFFWKLILEYVRQMDTLQKAHSGCVFHK